LFVLSEALTMRKPKNTCSLGKFSQYLSHVSYALKYTIVIGKTEKHLIYSSKLR
jgi:hypothetical protein